MTEVEMTTSEKLDHTLQAYGRLERRSAEQGRRIAELEAALREIVELRGEEREEFIARVLDTAETALAAKGKGQDS